MNLLKRSFLYLFRKWKVSILLLLILFMVVTLTLSGIAVLNAEEQKTEEFKEATGTSFSIERNYGSGGMATDEKGNTYLKSDAITQDMIKEIGSIEGIMGYNATVESISSVLKDGKYIPHSEDDLVGWDEVDSATMSITNINSKYSNYFISNIFELVEGEHITPDTENAIIVSDAYAKKNNLKIGDTLTVVNDPQNDDPFVDVEIIGIFRVVTDAVDDSDGKKIYDLAAYFEYNDYVFLSNDLSNKLYVNYDDAGNGVYDVVDFYVSNPENLDSIIQKVKNIKDINWKNFNIYTDDEVYKNTQDSVDNSSTLIISLIVIAIIVSISVISIIVFMSIKGRRREIGILLSIGKSKAIIVFQFIIEMLIISAISFTGSYFFSKLIAGSLGNAMGKVAESVIIQNNQFALITGIGIVILLSIVIISCIPIMNKKPRQILSQMN
ncbi:MAG TPA: ABC transporter permease [Candidatus Scatovivens faecipullorum]|nr:ABC transporter permease [Candidatus Scatovivens faecipullorum]